MAKPLALALLALLTLNSAAGADSFAEEVPSTTDWRRSRGVGKEKVTKLHFYFHDILRGPLCHPHCPGGDDGQSPALFGVVMMADDGLKVGRESDFKVVG